MDQQKVRLRLVLVSFSSSQWATWLVSECLKVRKGYSVLADRLFGSQLGGSCLYQIFTCPPPSFLGCFYFIKDLAPTERQPNIDSSPIPVFYLSIFCYP
jgi:hypothetical protein